VELVREGAARPDAGPEQLADLARLHTSEKDYAGAVELYRRALAARYGNVEWRYALARALAETGQVAEAMREARLCLRLRPEHAAAKQLLGDLSVRPSTATAPQAPEASEAPPPPPPPAD
jgi:Flp pilus assembly protein TadD